ncbi:MAG: sensor histidine kinase [Nitrosopumilus sp.]|nr:MAG: sensor histidine kinase [Nitrosopumilus sp.]
MAISKRGQIIDLISHELKTPTVPILGYCEMLLNPKFGKLTNDQYDAVKEIMKNILELQILIEQIIEKQKRVEEADSLDILPRELRTPLVPILGYCEMLNSEKLGPLDDFQKEALNEIQVNSNRLNVLINDFWNAQELELGKIKYHLELIDVTEFFNKISNKFSNSVMEKKISFSTNIESNLNVYADNSKLIQIFSNLIENSIVFVPENGKIIIEAKSQNGSIEFKVKDNGSGIPKEKHNELFKKFHQIDTSHRRAHGGGGLGLVIVKGFIEGMNGKISVESEEGKGTTFTINLPRKSKQYGIAH